VYIIILVYTNTVYTTGYLCYYLLWKKSQRVVLWSACNRPGHSRFEEKWLKDIIENKTIVVSKIDF